MNPELLLTLDGSHGFGNDGELAKRFLSMHLHCARFARGYNGG
jgi:hypothetical protein